MPRSTRSGFSYEPLDTVQPAHIFNEMVDMLEDGLLIIWQGVWSAGTYLKGDLVIKAGWLMIVSATTTTEEPLPGAADWDILNPPQESGFVDRSEATLSFTDGSRTFTITPTGSTFDFWQLGIYYTITGVDTIVIPETEGIQYIY